MSSKTSKPVPAATPASDEDKDQKKAKLALQDEDDWADFPVDDWTQATKTSEVDWEKGWDDEENDEEFKNELRAEIAKREEAQKKAGGR